MTLKNILAKTEEYLNMGSVIRFEKPFKYKLLEDFSEHNTLQLDGSVVVSKKDSKNPKIITCHIDRHGIVANNEGKLEYASFNAKKFYNAENVSS